jgi:hypothetical protein
VAAVVLVEAVKVQTKHLEALVAVVLVALLIVLQRVQAL